jgi:hypothetical protein
LGGINFGPLFATMSGFPFDQPTIVIHPCRAAEHLVHFDVISIMNELPQSVIRGSNSTARISEQANALLRLLLGRYLLDRYDFKPSNDNGKC